MEVALLDVDDLARREPIALVWTGSSAGNDRVYLHNGITATINSSFAVSYNAVGLGAAIDPAGNLVLEGTLKTFNVHSGITSTVSSSFAVAQPNPTGHDVTRSGT